MGLMLTTCAGQTEVLQSKLTRFCFPLSWHFLSNPPILTLFKVKFKKLGGVLLLITEKNCLKVLNVMNVQLFLKRCCVWRAGWSG